MLPSDNPLRLRQNLSKKICNKSWNVIKILEMKNYNVIYREGAKISALLSDKIDKYEYLTGEK